VFRGLNSNKSNRTAIRRIKKVLLLMKKISNAI